MMNMHFLPDVPVLCPVCTAGDLNERCCRRVSWPKHRRRAGHDHRRCAAAVRRRCLAAAERLSLLAMWGLGYFEIGPAGDDPSGGEDNASSWPKSWPAAPGVIPSTCSTNRPQDCTPPT